jgi:hypothetical protein
LKQSPRASALFAIARVLFLFSFESKERAMLRLRSRPEYPNSYLVMTGEATAGVISYVPHQHTWHWSITAFTVGAYPPFKGMQTASPTREEAIRNFAVEWRRWLAYCGLKEIEEIVDTEVEGAASQGRLGTILTCPI